MKTGLSSSRLGAQQQRGVVLFVALIVLIVMTLAGLALLRQMGIGTSIAGNVAFKENATSVADRGTEAAIAFIAANAPNNSNDSPANGYWSSWVGGHAPGTDDWDPTALDWNGASLSLADVAAIPDIAQTGNAAQIIIQRLCLTPGVSALSAAQQCSDIPVDNPFRSHGNPSPVPGMSTTTPSPFYRITTRVQGPRNTLSYTQVLTR